MNNTKVTIIFKQYELYDTNPQLVFMKDNGYEYVPGIPEKDWKTKLHKQIYEKDNTLIISVKNDSSFGYLFKCYKLIPSPPPKCTFMTTCIVCYKPNDSTSIYPWKCGNGIHLICYTLPHNYTPYTLEEYNLTQKWICRCWNCSNKRCPVCSSDATGTMSPSNYMYKCPCNNDNVCGYCIHQKISELIKYR
jgi:hypothetical protein